MASKRSRDATTLRLPVSIEVFARHLLEWYREHRRELPWRRDTDPYRIWLSEVMLQQTQVKTVLPYYTRFLERFPSLPDLAGAELSEVLSEWAGLGYYSRARNFHRAARIVCQKHDGEFPNDYQQALALPGVGRYTAGAILSIVYRQPVPVLDGNIRRFLTRFLRLDGKPSQTNNLWRLLEELVAEPVVSSQIVDFNQALMELGALVCTPRKPACHSCPLKGTCRALAAGVQEQLPRARRSPRIQHLHFAAAVVRRGSRLLVRLNQEGPLLRGFWEFPKLESHDSADLEKQFQDAWGVSLEVMATLPPVPHQITHHRLSLTPVICSLKSSRLPEGWTWTDLEQRSLPLPAYVRKIDRKARAWLQQQSEH